MGGNSVGVEELEGILGFGADGRFGGNEILCKGGLCRRRQSKARQEK